MSWFLCKLQLLQSHAQSDTKLTFVLLCSFLTLSSLTNTTDSSAVLHHEKTVFEARPEVAQEIDGMVVVAVYTMTKEQLQQGYVSFNRVLQSPRKRKGGWGGGRKREGGRERSEGVVGFVVVFKH